MLRHVQVIAIGHNGHDVGTSFQGLSMVFPGENLSRFHKGEAQCCQVNYKVTMFIKLELRPYQRWIGGAKM